MSEWNHIKTAPYDQPILVSWQTSDGTKIVEQVWKTLTFLWAGNELEKLCGLDRFLHVWSTDPQAKNVLDIKPTHWMPLPDPPE